VGPGWQRRAGVTLLESGWRCGASSASAIFNSPNLPLAKRLEKTSGFWARPSRAARAARSRGADSGGNLVDFEDAGAGA
jgi:hypothetical protein